MAINIPGSPNHSTRLVSLGVSAAALATEVRASSITKLPSNSSPASCLHPSSAQRLVNPNEDQLVLAVPQQIIPHFEQSEHSQTFHQQAPATTHRPSSLSEFPEPALDTPPSTNPSDNHRDTVLSLTPSKNIATADRQSASSPSAYIPTSDILQTDVTKVASSPVDTPAAEALPKKKKKNKKKNKKKSTTDAADGSAPEKSSSSPQNTGACVFSYQKPIAAVNPASGIEDPLMAAAAAAIRDQRNNEIRRAIAGNVKVFITTNSNASLGDVQAEYAAAGAKPSSTPYQLAEGQLVEDLRPRNLLPQSIQDYVRELPSHMQEKEKSKKSE
ncbi:hypothetical protein T440DRAFT_470819 [Plenodomus tracheiphilus IPT5]|uniref:Uncharacterized protein n=1 Tax=Plenodomus tracheiphilus IPT5 TaxID=1408161 RepID=A0A6A7AY66_9PLEO|nr:hypothetical protein T440DRAFT_470819 [Plenodomus tracheiphilus IPT5]